MRSLLAWSAGFLIAGAAFGGRAVAHWRELTLFGPICGDGSTAHCGWCYAAAVSLAAAATLAALAANSLDRPTQDAVANAGRDLLRRRAFHRGLSHPFESDRETG